MMALQTMIVRNGLMRTNDQYPRSPRQTIRMTKSTSSSFDAPNFKDRSSSFTAEVLFALRMNFAVALCHVVFLRNQAGVARCPGWLPRPLRRALPPGLGVSRCRNSAFFLALLGSASEARHVRFSNRPFGVKRFQTIHHYSVDVAHGLVLLFGIGTRGPSIMGFENEVEQSFGRPCRQTNGRSKRTCELTSSIVPRGTSFHRSVELECPSIGLDAARFSCCCCGLFSGPAELGAVNPYAVHDHGQSTRQGHNRLFQPAAPGDLHRPGLEPGPFCRTHQH